MKTIFDCETEIATWDANWEQNGARANGSHSPGWKVFVHTLAVLTKSRGMLKIEQRCFFRAGNEVSDHPAVKPDLLLEPALETEEESLSLVRGIHSRFAERVRRQITDPACGPDVRAVS